MKLLKRLLIVLLILVTLLVATAVAVPIIYKKDIVSLIKSDVNAALNAEVAFDEDISVRILPSFPNLSVSVKDIRITGKDIFAQDTLIACEQLKATIGLKELFKNHNIKLIYVELQKPNIQLKSAQGKDNWDIVKSDDSEASDISLSANFNKVIVQNGRFSYIDSSATTAVIFQNITGSFNGKYAQDTFDLVSLFDCGDAYISYDNIPYVYHLPVKTEATTSVNLLTDEYRFKENQFWAGNVEVTAQGGMKYIGDSLSMDITYASNKTTFQDLFSLIPAYYKEELTAMNATGDASVSGTVKGILSDTELPGYTFRMNLNNGSIAHAELPEKIRNVNIDLAVDNPDGKDESLVVQLNNTGFNFQGNPFELALYVADIYRDPIINGKVKGNLVLDNLNALVPKSLKTTLGGKLLCDLSVNGRLSNIETGNVQKINTLGTLVATDLVYDHADNPNPIKIKKGHLNFTENMVRIPVMDVSSGKSSVVLTGGVDNLIGYVFNNQTLTGNLTVSSNLLDVSDFMVVEETNAESSNEPIELPDHIDVSLVYDIQEFQYTTHQFEAIKGSCQLANKALNIKELSTNCLDGQVVLQGVFNTVDPSKPLADMNLIVQNLNIQKAFTSFETIRLLAPIADRLKGKFSSTIKVKTELLGDLSPNLSNITCQGILDIFDCDVEGMQAMNEIGKKLNLAEFQKPFKLKDLLMSFSIKDGKIEVSPFTIPVGESTLNMMGYSKLDNSINFNGLLSIPKKLYEANQKQFNSYIPKNKLSNIDSFEWSDLEFDVDIQGSFKNPVVKLDYKSTKKRVIDNVKSQVKSRIDDEKADLRKQAEDELNEAKRIAEEAKKAAEERAKAAIDEQQKKLEEQIAKEKAAAQKRIEDELKKKKQEALKNKLPLPPK